MVNESENTESAKKTFIYIDGTNLHKGIQGHGKVIDYKKFHKWLLHKYRVTKSYIFMGYISSQQPLYEYLEKCGFMLIFKETVLQKNIIKGNADAEMVLQTVRDFYEKCPTQVILVSGDGDFSCLVDFLQEKKVFRTILVPNRRFCSYLLRKKGCSMTYLDHERLLPRIIV